MKITGEKDRKLPARAAQIAVVCVWLAYIFSLVFLADLKHTRYKLIGMELSLLALFGLWSCRGEGDPYEILKDSSLYPVFAFAAAFSLFYFVPGSRPSAFDQWQRIIFSCLAFFAAYRILPCGYRENIFNTLLIAAGLISLYAVLQKYGGVWIIRVPRLQRVYATFGNPNFLASFLAGTIPLGLTALIEKKKIWISASLVLMILAMYFTQTRGAWLGLAGASALWYFVLRKERPSRKVVIAFLFLIVIFTAVNADKLTRQTQRLLIWRDTLRMAVSNPVLGVGIGQFHNEFPSYASEELKKILPPGKFIVNYAHNEFLEILSETGIAGFGLYAWLIVMVYAAGMRRRDSGWIREGALFGVTAVLLHSFVSVNMRFSVSSIWVFLLMGISMNGFDDALAGYRPSVKKRIPLMLAVLLFIGFWGRKAVDPLISHRRLAGEVDFFDTEREYSKDELSGIIEKGTDNAMVYYKLGWVQAKDREFEEAIGSFERAVELDDRLAGAYNNLGNIYFTLGERGKAANYYIKAININPNLTDAHFNLGYIFYHQGRLKEASAEFTIVLKQNPDNYKAKTMLEKMVQ
ncbi:MAG: tetratricopeptide repeat protein [Elusimicrobia bacterium]|nr:tetratricopeptide repeat protein [Elusimicrobiota bacterium]